MKPIDFDGSNATFAEDQPEYFPLRAHRDEEGVVTSCWGMTLLERLLVLFTGRIYLSIMTFNKPLQPQKLTVNKPCLNGD